MVGATAVTPRIRSVCDVAVSLVEPRRILVASENGQVHLVSSVESGPDRTWDCAGGKLRVGWIGGQPVAWNATTGVHAFWVLRADGTVVRHSIPSEAEVALYDDGFYVAQHAVRLAQYELNQDGSLSHELRAVPATGHIHGTLTAARDGAVAFAAGGQLFVQTHPSRPWLSLSVLAEVCAFSPCGSYVACAAFRSEGSSIHIVRVAHERLSIATAQPVQALPKRVTALEWSLDSSSLLCFSPEEGDVRSFEVSTWSPGVWTVSMMRPRFADNGVLVVPETREVVQLAPLSGEPTQIWSCSRSTCTELFNLSGNQAIRRGDRVLVFERRPRVRPIAMYEVISGARKDDPALTGMAAQVVCRLRVAYPEVLEHQLNHARDLIDRLAAADGRPLDGANVQRLVDELFGADETIRTQTRMLLPPVPPALKQQMAVSAASSSPATADRDAVYDSSVPQEPNVSAAVLDAIEASYYIAPDAPGLTLDELIRALADLGFGKGEVSDALRAHHTVGTNVNGNVFDGEELPLFLTQYAVRFETDPRNWEAFAFVMAKLQDLAKKEGLGAAKLGIAELVVEGVNHGFSQLHLLQAVHGLPLMKHARLEPGNQLALTQQGSSMWLPNKPSAGTVVKRAHFSKLLASVARERSKRDPEVRWKALEEKLAALPKQAALTPDEAAIIADICTHFADSGDPVSLDDVLRRLPDLEVRSIAYSRLIEDGQLHARQDTKVVPSLEALLRHANVFSATLLLADDMLVAAKRFWDQKASVVPLSGPNALLPATRPGAPTPEAARQLALLLECVSFSPCLVPQSPTRVEIRDEIRHHDTLPKLLEHRLRNATQPKKPASETTPPPSMAEDNKSVLHSPAEAAIPKVTSRPTMFIGSTVEALEIARSVHSELDYDIECTIWNQDMFRPGSATWTTLLERAPSFDFALFIFSGDDRAQTRGEESLAIRDNVLIEFGLFAGVLGAKRTFFLFDRTAKPRIASDLAGITGLTYQQREDRNLIAAVTPACATIRRIAKDLGRRS